MIWFITTFWTVFVHLRDGGAVLVGLETRSKEDLVRTRIRYHSQEADPLLDTDLVLKRISYGSWKVSYAPSFYSYIKKGLVRLLIKIGSESRRGRHTILTRFGSCRKNYPFDW